MDSRDFLEKKGIEPTTIVAYHYTGDPEDGIDIDIELLMNEFRDEILKEREQESSDESAALPLHDVNGSYCYEIDFGGHCKTKIETTNNEPKVLAAMNGWGDGISLNDVKITKL